MMTRIALSLAAALAVTAGTHASIAYPSSTDEARAAAALANGSTYAAGGYTFGDDVAVQTDVRASPSGTDQARAAAAAGTSTSTRAAGGLDPERRGEAMASKRAQDGRRVAGAMPSRGSR